MSVLPPPVGSPGWYADPASFGAPDRQRWWDGSWWTDQCVRPSGDGHWVPLTVFAPARPMAVGSVPVCDERRPVGLTTLPFRIGAIAVVLQLFVLVAEHVLSASASTSALAEANSADSSSVRATVVAIILAVVIGYGPALGYGFIALRKHAGRSWRQAVGFRFRAADLGWGPLVWLAILGGQIVVGIVLNALQVPLSSNVPEPTSDPEWWRFVPIALVAIIIAPLFEEFVFRGLLLRSLRSKLELWPSIVIQGALFAVAHMQPGFGWGNVGLVVLLAWVGSALGYAAHHFGRIWPGILAHSTINTLAITVLIIRAYW